jgi:hypothetical protein
MTVAPAARASPFAAPQEETGAARGSGGKTPALGSFSKQESEKNVNDILDQTSSIINSSSLTNAHMCNGWLKAQFMGMD